MALDEPKDEDLTLEEGGIQFVLDSQTTDIVRQSGGLTIDYLNEDHRRGYMLSLGNSSDCGESSDGCSGCG